MSLNKSKLVLSLVILAILGLAVFFLIEKYSRSYETDEFSVVSYRENANGEKYLTDLTGRTLYTFKGDGVLKSNCDLTCLKLWPAYFYTSTKDLSLANDFMTKNMAIFERHEVFGGESFDISQYAYGLQPVYYYAKDLKPGDMNGHGQDNGNWNIVIIK